MLFADVTRLLIRNIQDIRHTGIDRVNLEYARRVHAKGGKLCLRFGRQLKVLSGRAWPRLMLHGPQPGETGRRRARLEMFLRALALKRSMPAESAVMVTTHSWLANADTWEWVRQHRLRAFVFIHDLIPITFPEYSHPREKALHVRRISHVLRHSRGIIVNSCCTESALRLQGAQAGVKPPPILVAPLGLDFMQNVPERPSPVQAPYFVILGTIEPRKNHLLLLTLWRELARQLGRNTPRLVVVGRRGWECEQVVDLLERCETIRPFLVERNTASDAEVSVLLRGATALLMPSFAEGFGLPVQEALALGTPVISSPLPAIKEFARDIPDYADPLDGVRWMDLIKDYAGPGSPRRREQMERLRLFQPHAWSGHFAAVDDFVASLG